MGRGDLGHCEQHAHSPLKMVQHLFTCDHPDAPAKVEFHWMMVVAGGWACLRHPQFLWMLIPIYAQKMLSNAPSFWGVGRQYSIEFVPIISLAVVHLASKHRRLFQVVYPLLFVVTLASTIVKFKQRKDFFKRNASTCFMRHITRRPWIWKPFEMSLPTFQTTSHFP